MKNVDCYLCCPPSTSVKDPGYDCDFELLKLSWIDLNWLRSLLQSDRTQKKQFKCYYGTHACIWQFKDDRWPMPTFHPQTSTLHLSWKPQTWQSILLFSPGFLLLPTSTATSSPTDTRTATQRYQTPRHILDTTTSDYYKYGSYDLFYSYTRPIFLV